MGLDDAQTLQLDSPFDYPNNALMWLPEHLPEPRELEFVPALLEIVVPLLEASRGRVFLLFTSHRNLRRAAELLALRFLFHSLSRETSLAVYCWFNSGNPARVCCWGRRVFGRVWT